MSTPTNVISMAARSAGKEIARQLTSQGYRITNERIENGSLTIVSRSGVRAVRLPGCREILEVIHNEMTRMEDENSL